MSEKEPNFIGAILRRERIERRVTMTAIAFALEISVSYLSELETGHKRARWTDGRVTAYRLAVSRAIVPPAPLCKIPQCPNLSASLGLCAKHYQRWKKHGDTNTVLPFTTLRHGHATRKGDSPEYRTWAGMLSRCNNLHTKDYAYYGTRGITVCERWHNFENFLADMGEKPTPLHTIERIDNDGNYDSRNCKWATRLEQAHNQRPRRKRGAVHV